MLITNLISSTIVYLRVLRYRGLKRNPKNIITNFSKQRKFCLDLTVLYKQLHMKQLLIYMNPDATKGNKQ